MTNPDRAGAGNDRHVNRSAMHLVGAIVDRYHVGDRAWSTGLCGMDVPQTTTVPIPP